MARAGDKDNSDYADNDEGEGDNDGDGELTTLRGNDAQVQDR